MDWLYQRTLLGLAIRNSAPDGELGIALRARKRREPSAAAWDFKEMCDKYEESLKAIDGSHISLKAPEAPEVFRTIPVHSSKFADLIS